MAAKPATLPARRQLLADLADAEIAERLGRTVTDVRQTARVPYQRQADGSRLAPAAAGRSRVTDDDCAGPRLIPMLG
jgi:hypothetical protein